MSVPATMVFLVLYVLGANILFRKWRGVVYNGEDSIGKILLYGFEAGVIILGILLVKEGPMLLAILGSLGSGVIIYERLEEA